jgi:hypothetical protein
LAKLKLAGDNAAAGAMPVPAKVTGDTATLLLLLSDSDPPRLPVAAGVKIILMMQLLFGAKVLL